MMNIQDLEKCFQLYYTYPANLVKGNYRRIVCYAKLKEELFFLCSLSAYLC